MTGLENMCPMRALVEVMRRHLVKKYFLKTIHRGKQFTTYLSKISGVDASYSAYALRIGRRRWLLNQGLDRQFCDFLGVWKCPDAFARYYRANPAAVLTRVRKLFFESLNNSL